jgi:hypothetical protein
MARNHRILWSWERFSRAIRLEDGLRLWSRFPLELAPDLIVCPHLFDWPASAPRGTRGRDVYTCAAAPEVVVFSAVSPAHRRFLEEEVVPRVREHVRFVALVDFEADQLGFAPLGGPMLPAAHLAPLLEMAWGRERVAAGAFSELGRAPESGFEEMFFGPDDERPEDAARCEAHPLRLWEAFFWRGHTYRYEVIDGEIPLVGDLRSPLAANRTLLQLVRDAERFEASRAGEHEGWIRCGRFRMRQQGRLVEVRARLTPADARAALMPVARVPGDDQLPTLLGALMAGGDNGKTELWNGFTWSTIQLASAAQSREAAHALADAIERWTETKATVSTGDAFKLPEESREEWFLVPHREWLTVYVPFAREECLPWQVSAGGFWRPQAPRAEGEEEDESAGDDP